MYICFSLSSTFLPNFFTNTYIFSHDFVECFFDFFIFLKQHSASQNWCTVSFQYQFRSNQHPHWFLYTLVWDWRFGMQLWTVPNQNKMTAELINLLDHSSSATLLLILSYHYFELPQLFVLMLKLTDILLAVTF